MRGRAARRNPVSYTHLDVYKRQVMEYSAAFLQIYREEGYYLERTCHYIARVGLDHVKAAVAVSYTHLDVYKRQPLDSGSKPE